MPEAERAAQAAVLRELGRPIRRYVRLLVWIALVLALVLGGARAAAHRIRQDPVPAAKWLAGRLGQRLAGQHTQALALEVSLDPAAGRLDATATLTLVSGVANRRRYYFLFNPKLKLSRVEMDGRPCRVSRLWVLTRVTVPRAPVPGVPFPLTFAYAGDPTGGLGERSTSYLDADGVLLNVAEFWYPSDAQSFFDVDLTVRLPAGMTFVATGDVQEDRADGAVRMVRETWPRPLAGLALVAGPYAVESAEADGRRYDLYVPPGLPLARDRLLAAMRESDAMYAARFGPSGFVRHGLVILPRVVRAFNDGGGLMGLPPPYIRGGNYGYGTIAHEVAHNWWGASVAERWLDAGTGGEWLVEGFAEMSAIWALERRFGPAATMRESERAQFPPNAHRPLREMSAIDNLLGPDAARWTIYRKGGAVATLLRRTLGDATFAAVCRAFQDAYRYTRATDAQFAAVAAEVSGRNLDVFFARWVRDAALVDFAVEAGPEPGSAVLRNLGPVEPHQRVYVALDSPERKAVFEVARVNIGEPQPHVFVGEGARLIADPPLEWPDMRRSNNVWPREYPVRWHIPAPVRGRTATSGGFPQAWEPHVLTMHGGGAPDLRYPFPRAVWGAPVWWPDGRHLLVSIAGDTPEAEPEMWWVAAYGPDAVAEGEETVPPNPESLGPGTMPTVLDPERGTFLCVVDDRIMLGRIGGAPKRHLARGRWKFSYPQVAPGGRRALCSGRRDARSALWVWDPARPDEARIVWEQERSYIRGWWLPDGRRAVVLRGRDDRHVLVELDTETGETRDLVTGMALIGDVLVTPTGRVVFTARQTLDYPFNGLRLYEVDRATGVITPLPLPTAGRLVSYSRPRWDRATGEVVCIRERAVPQFSARYWAWRDVIALTIPPR